MNDEWSAVETLRHLVFVHDSWFRRCCLGRTDLFTPMGLGPEFVADEEQGLDRSATPTLDEVRAVRRDQAAELEAWLATVTADELQHPHRCPRAPAGRRTHGAGACPSACTRCSTRSGPTTASACATSTGRSRRPTTGLRLVGSRHERDDLSPAGRLGPDGQRRRHRLQRVRPPGRPRRRARHPGRRPGRRRHAARHRRRLRRPGRQRGAARRALQGRRDDFVVATKFGMDMQGANGADCGARGSRATSAVRSRLRCAGYGSTTSTSTSSTSPTA